VGLAPEVDPRGPEAIVRIGPGIPKSERYRGSGAGRRYDAEESVVIERLLREYNHTIPDAQLVPEVGLALAIHRRSRG
jgi:hypothetical protein